jgi:Homeodomain-like domain
MCHARLMAQMVCPLVSAEDRARLEAIVADRNRAQKHVARARIILGSADRLKVAEIARHARVGRPAVWRWQRRFAEAGVEGLLRDATRKPGKAPLGDQTVRRVVTLTCAEPPGEATQWTGRAMAKAAGISLRAVQRIWAAHDLQPHRIRTFKRSSDPAFAAKLEDIVGLYVDPPKHAIVLSVDEKSQIQALDRTQPGLPIKPGKAGTMTHDYRRNGITTLFAALNILDGTVLGRCMQRHRDQDPRPDPRQADSSECVCALAPVRAVPARQRNGRCNESRHSRPASHSRAVTRNIRLTKGPRNRYNILPLGPGNWPHPHFHV